MVELDNGRPLRAAAEAAQEGDTSACHGVEKGSPGLVQSSITLASLGRHSVLHCLTRQ
ncbi:hypothetical protein O9992_24285 [Vibrio lentus]|nr:hypothetical protein [Vibrio lentus]